MDDTEMGRPVRHARRHHSSRGGFMDDVLRRGEKAPTHVSGKRACRCGAEIAVDFTGPDDSLGVRLARGTLENATCDECRAADEAAADAEREAAAHVERVRNRVKLSGVPELWRTLAFEELREHSAHEHQEQAIELASAWAREGGGLLLHGKEGRGKTLIAAAAAVARATQSGVRWLNVAELLMDLRMPFEAPEYARAQRKINDVARAGLVLDDLDKLKPTEHALQPLYVAINAWVQARQPLLVTCNRDLDNMASWMGESFGGPIASRLAGYCDVVEIKGRDWRLE